MEDLISKDELMKRWKCKTDALAKIEADGYIQRCPHVPGIKYRMKDVYRCEGGTQYDPLSPMERKKLLAELQEKDERIRMLEARIRKAAADFFNLNMEVMSHEVSK